jgi:hypothetical protein
MNQDKQKKQPSQEERAKQLAEDLVQKLQAVTDEETIRLVTLESWEKLQEIAPNENSFRRCRKIFRDIIKSVFPHKLLDDGYSPSVKPSLSYYYTEAKEDKKATPRWEHLALWYSTTSKGREDVVGDKARVEYFSQWEQNYSENFKKWKQSVLSGETAQEAQKIKQVKLRLEDMTLEQLELDAETQEIVSNALEHSGMPIADFIRQACKVYAKTLTGKAKQSTEDLSTIPTNELREGKAYKTHPGRAEELVKRAIQAITLHNGQATEVNQKWLITQTLLLEMTGSKIPTIQELVGRKAKDGTVLKTGKYQTNVDDINKRLKDDYGVDDYLNRKPKEVKEKFIQEWVTLVPNGLDDFNSSPMPEHIVEPVFTVKPEKITKLPTTATTLDIIDYLGSHPNESVQIKGDNGTLTYERVDDERGYMKAARVVETGEEIPA